MNEWKWGVRTCIVVHTASARGTQVEAEKTHLSIAQAIRIKGTNTGILGFSCKRWLKKSTAASSMLIENALFFTLIALLFASTKTTKKREPFCIQICVILLFCSFNFHKCQRFLSMAVTRPRSNSNLVGWDRNINQRNVWELTNLEGLLELGRNWQEEKSAEGNKKQTLCCIKRRLCWIELKVITIWKGRRWNKSIVPQFCPSATTFVMLPVPKATWVPFSTFFH